MVLLSEVVERLRDEWGSWAPESAGRLEIRLCDKMPEARIGDSRALEELLSLALGGAAPGTDAVLSVCATDGDAGGADVVFLIEGDGIPPEDARERLEAKLAAMGGGSATAPESGGIEIRIPLPPARTYPPADLGAMARETGLTLAEAAMVARGAVPHGRSALARLMDCGSRGDWKGFHRAAHALKGMGMNLRAPEVAAAARAVELKANEAEADAEAMDRLALSWKVFEEWIREGRYDS